MESEKTLRYILTKPSATRRKFALVCYTSPDRLTKVYQELEPALRATVTATNEQFTSGAITQSEAEVLFKNLIDEQYKKAGVFEKVLRNSVISKANQKLLNSYWKAEYANRFLVDEKSMRYELENTIRLLEPLSITTAEPAELLGQLKKKTATRKKLRRAIDRTNQLLSYLGREKLAKPPPPVHKIVHVTLEQFKTAVHYLQPEDRRLALTLFATGLRLSEALAITENDLIGGRLNVDKQQTKTELKLPKKEKTGRILVIPELLPAVQEWVKVEDKEAYRTRIYNELYRACKLAKIPFASAKILRHSHAIHLLSAGATLTQVAFNLRNTLEVCQRYYAGYAHTDETLESLNRALTSR